jgi:hypothetical protein
VRLGQRAVIGLSARLFHCESLVFTKILMS